MNATAKSRCIFCGRGDDLTDEHVFPAFMGGKLEVREGSCQECNGSFHHWEGDIKRETELLLHLLRIGNRNDVVPSTVVDFSFREMEHIDGMEKAGKLRAVRSPNEKIKFQDKVWEFVTEDGRKVRRGFFTSDESAERFIAKSKARGEETKELTVPENPTVDSSASFTLRFCETLNTRKVVAKIALAALAYKYGADYARSPQFDTLRDARNATSLKGFPVEVFCNAEFMAAQTRTVHQHSVIGYLSAGQKKGWSIVTLFGGITYLVQLSESFEETSSRQFSIYFDASTKRQFNPVVLAGEMSMVKTALSKNSVLENSKAIDEQWSPLFEAYCLKAGIKVSVR